MKFEDFYNVKNQRFFYLYKKLKLKDQKLMHLLCLENISKFFFKNRIGRYSALITLTLIILESTAYCFDGNVIVNKFFSLIETLISSQIGLLAFIIAGVTILIGSLSNEMLEIIDRNNVAEYLLDLLFSFYYIAAFIGLSIVLLIFTYVFILIPLPHKWCMFLMFLIFSIFNTFFVIYSLIYSVSLIGTCIRMFLLKYKFWGISKENQKKIKRKNIKIKNIKRKKPYNLWLFYNIQNWLLLSKN